MIAKTKIDILQLLGSSTVQCPIPIFLLWMGTSHLLISRMYTQGGNSMGCTCIVVLLFKVLPVVPLWQLKCLLPSFHVSKITCTVDSSAICKRCLQVGRIRILQQLCGKKTWGRIADWLESVLHKMHRPVPLDCAEWLRLRSCKSTPPYFVPHILELSLND